eukprot:6204197-Pleurochrysis_carterae.AAC.6
MTCFARSGLRQALWSRGLSAAGRFLRRRAAAGRRHGDGGLHCVSATGHGDDDRCYVAALCFVTT